jgi:hypothetical protein
MAWWPLHKTAGERPHEPGTLASSWPTSVTATASATINTKGSYIQVVASTPSAWDGFWLLVSSNFVTATNTSTLIDVATGAAASEVVQLANMSVGYNSASPGVHWIYIPLTVPSGTRIAVRTQSVVASKTQILRVVGVPASNRGAVGPGQRSYGTCNTYGAVTGSSRGTSVTASATINTLGAWTQIVASSTGVTRALLVRVDGNSSAAITASTARVQIGIGAAASEAQVGPDMFFATDATEFIVQQGPGLTVPIDGLAIPAGSRISARIASSVASQGFGITVHAFT